MSKQKQTTAPLWIAEVFLPKFRLYRNKNYFIKYGKDQSLVKKLLEQIDETELTRRVDVFFSNYGNGKYDKKKDYFGGDATIPLFFDVINEIEQGEKEGFQYKTL